MRNPKNKKSHEQFVNELKIQHPTIVLLDEYINTDTKIRYKCDHGEHLSRPWQLLKMKHCCRQGYYNSGVMWESNLITLKEARERAMRDRSNIDVSETYFVKHGNAKKLTGIICTKHNVQYDSFISQKIGLCPECNKERNLEQLKIAAPLAWAARGTGTFVSKNETEWLDTIGITERQVWLEDIKYKVDGYDSKTNTVYLYHGKFWHGCPETFDPEMIHPVVKIPMKDLYEKTLMYEQKIKDAGYNLIVKWGT